MARAPRAVAFAFCAASLPGCVATRLPPELTSEEAAIVGAHAGKGGSVVVVGRPGSPPSHAALDAIERSGVFSSVVGTEPPSESPAADWVVLLRGVDESDSSGFGFPTRTNHPILFLLSLGLVPVIDSGLRTASYDVHPAGDAVRRPLQVQYPTWSVMGWLAMPMQPFPGISTAQSADAYERRHADRLVFELCRSGLLDRP